MVYKFFDEKSSSDSCFAIKQIQQLAEELNKPIIRKLKKREVYLSFKDNIWGADLADMQLLSKFSKGIRFLLCVIDIFSKYSWFVPLKDKKAVTITNAFQNILDESGRKPNKIWQVKAMDRWVDKDQCNLGYKIYAIYKCIQQIMQENLLLQKDLLDFKN